MRSESFGSVRVFWPLYDRQELIALLREKVRLLATILPLKRVVLFGSWAKGRATAFSDIDLLVVYAGPARGDAYEVVRQCIALRGLEPHVHAEGGAAKMSGTLDRMAKDGIDLFPNAGPEPEAVPAGL